jgi:hypothetical protein
MNKMETFYYPSTLLITSVEEQYYEGTEDDHTNNHVYKIGIRIGWDLIKQEFYLSNVYFDEQDSKDFRQYENIPLNTSDIEKVWEIVDKLEKVPPRNEDTMELLKISKCSVGLIETNWTKTIEHNGLWQDVKNIDFTKEYMLSVLHRIKDINEHLNLITKLKLDQDEPFVRSFHFNADLFRCERSDKDLFMKDFPDII